MFALWRRNPSVCLSVTLHCCTQPIIFRWVVLAKILYASPAWWGFANSSDKQRIEAMRRCARLNYFIAKTIPLRVSLLPIWMTALFACWTISTFFVVFCLNAILIRTVLGLGAMNLCWQPSAILETFLKDNCLQICIDILFSCVLSTVFQRLKWSEDKERWTFP